MNASLSFGPTFSFQYINRWDAITAAFLPDFAEPSVCNLSSQSEILESFLTQLYSWHQTHKDIFVGPNTKIVVNVVNVDELQVLLFDFDYSCTDWLNVAVFNYLATDPENLSKLTGRYTINACFPSLEAILQLFINSFHPPPQARLGYTKQNQLYALYQLDPKRLMACLRKVTGLEQPQLSFVDRDGANDLQKYQQMRCKPSFLKGNNKARAEHRLQELLQLVSLHSYEGIRDMIEQQATVFVDIGGEQGDFAHAIAQWKPVQSYCVEVQNWYSRTHEPVYMDVEYKYVTTNRLPFEDCSIDFVSVLQVLHHVEQVTDMLREIYRVLKDGGLLFIREHDCVCLEDQLTIDIEHKLYEAVLKKNLEFVGLYKAQYFSQRYLFSLLMSLGFELVNHSVPTGVSKSYQVLFVKTKLKHKPESKY
jgi:SAM-dependent methyltransferase